MNAYSRTNPSPRYVELLGYYQDMHEHGARAQNIPAEETFDGRSLPKHAGNIQGIIGVLGSQTVLDYGSGKGKQYEPMNIELPDGRSFPDIKAFWGVQSITCYDPGYEPFSQLPEGKFDGVISTDMLEHIPAEDIPWVLEEMFARAREFVYMNVACYPAKKTLPNGENAHCTLEPPEWWQGQMDQVLDQFPGLRYYAAFEVPQAQPDGSPGLSMTLRQGKNIPQ